MTKEDFLIVSDLLTGYDLDELDKVEFFMRYEQKSNTKIPDEWFAEASLPKSEHQTDWSSFRREAAKDILVAVIAKKSSMCSYGEVVEEAIKFADELIRQLKEKMRNLIDEDEQ